MRARLLLVLSVIVLIVASGPPLRGQPQNQPPSFRAGTELVLVNVVVRDNQGFVRGLTQNDFTILEDGKPQSIQSFDFEDLQQMAATQPPETVPVLAGNNAGAAVSAATGIAARPVQVDMSGRRLIVLFFDLSSLEQPELRRAVSAAREYVNGMAAADLIAVVSFSTSLQLNQDFTSDRDRLLAAVGQFDGSSPGGLQASTTAADTSSADTAFTADDTEYNIFGNDMRLLAIQNVADALSGIDQKKSLIYFSNGLSQSGEDNQVQLRRTIDRAVRANVSIYTPDMRGLQAIVPGGEARQASAGGQGAYSGTGVVGQFSANAASQDTLSTLGEDTGGRAFFDANSFGEVFARVVADTSSYYVLGYSSSNTARDGRFRRITVRVNRPGLKLEYRKGYYAGRDFAHATRDDREQELQDQLLTDVSSTDLSSYVTASYFRIAASRYFVPLSIAVPGDQIPFGTTGRGSSSTIDVLGIVENSAKRPVGRVRDTIKLDDRASADIKRKIVQYETGLELAPGAYRLKFVVRENLSGLLGSYETTLTVPDLKDAPLKTSSIIVGTQMQDAGKDARNPLVRDGRRLVPNVTRVVTPQQHLYFYYEVYDAAAAPNAADVNVATSLSFFRGSARAFETAPVEARVVTVPGRKAVVFQFDVPAATLTPGVYTCQVNIVDETAGTFMFPRLTLYVRN